MTTILACIGGFLGAGKTTAIQAAAAELKRRGKVVAVIVNDQGSELVDTASMRDRGLATAEITGGCFCCKFTDLVATMLEIVEREHPDMILAEAVGSCTDLSATVYQPLRKYHRDMFTLAPLSVLVEPGRIHALGVDRSAAFPDSVGYLFEKQLAEADLVVLSKLDTIDSKERRATVGWLRDNTIGSSVVAISGRTGNGVDVWVDRLLEDRAAGGRLLDIDYDTYAAAEAALGWLNATVELSAASDFSARLVAEDFIMRAQQEIRAAGMAIAHLKLMVAAGASSDRIALTTDNAEAQWSGAASFGAARQASLIVNARIRAEPDELTKLTQRAINDTARKFALSAAVHHLECFSPARPTPEHRFAEIAL